MQHYMYVLGCTVSGSIRYGHVLLVEIYDMGMYCEWKYTIWACTVSGSIRYLSFLKIAQIIELKIFACIKTSSCSSLAQIR